MKFNNQTRMWEAENRDLNVVCPYCEKNLKADEISHGKCIKCNLNLRVEFLRKEGILFMGIDEKISQLKIKEEK